MKHVFLCLFLWLAASAASSTLEPVKLKPADPNEKNTRGGGLQELIQAETWTTASDVTSPLTYRPDEDNIYYFFSRLSPTIGFPVKLYNRQLLEQADFNPQRRTVVLVHGWLGNITDTINLVLVPAFLQTGDYNVIVVDWGEGASANYFSSVANTVTSGRGVATFIDWLNSITGASCANYHLVGHSLGGQQVGIIGRNVNCDIDYITALDPALPLWLLNPNRFKSDDGVYTEVLHTNAGEAGQFLPIGQVDFYANNGVRMPGCDGQNCSHDRCVWYFAESLTSGGFMGTQCSNFIQAMACNCSGEGSLHMGGTQPKHGATGIYHFDTNPGPPFSLD